MPLGLSMFVFCRDCGFICVCEQWEGLQEVDCFEINCSNQRHRSHKIKLFQNTKYNIAQNHKMASRLLAQCQTILKRQI